ncbi:MAG: family deacetylase [Firmicutes bacterium]|nr:family deacetylase [Bacillota bacterium]
MIIKIIKKVIAQSFGVMRKLQWLYQYYTLKIEKKHFKAELLNLNQFNKIMILIPHADDELIGCYNIIKNSKKQVVGYYLGFNGSNKSEENAIIRKNEIESIANALDFKLKISNGDRNKQLMRILINENPDLICVPSFIDWHNEHIEANRILINVLEKLKDKRVKVNILTYQVSVPMLEKDITHFQSMSKISQNEKWHLFKVYKSQEYMPSFRFKLNEKVSGKLISCYAAEVYRLFRYDEYKEEFNKWERIDKSQLKRDINNLINIRKIVNKMKCYRGTVFYGQP